MRGPKLLKQAFNFLVIILEQTILIQIHLCTIENL